MASLAFLRSLTAVALLVTPAASQALGGERPAPGPPVEYESPHGVRRLENPAQFSRHASQIGFNRMRRGSAVDKPLGLYGVRLWLGPAQWPLVWHDPSARTLPLPSRSAIENRRPAGRVGGASADWALRATFDLPVNRAGFELRRRDGEELNVILRCFSGGVELGSQFFDADRRFRFVGVQSAEPFDELWVEFTNPSDVRFSLDNLLVELDLRDGDRDGLLDFDDPCPSLGSFGRLDTDADGLGDGCDPYPFDPLNDADTDGLGADQDNCPLLFNPDQRDGDGDGLGDACDDYDHGSDLDDDGFGDQVDNCPTTFNPEQADCDADGTGDVCDPSLVNPAEVQLQLGPGECATLTKSLCLPPAPPLVDVLILFDTTGSMGGEIRALRNGITNFVNGVRQALPLSNIRFGLATFKDYPAAYSSCRYSAQYSQLADTPFEVRAPFGVADEQLLTAVNSLRARGGQDEAEAYARALWEVTQPDSGLAFRANSARFVVLVGDAPPHDCNLGAHLAGCIPVIRRGRDPGRDQILFTPDDLDFQRDALRGLIDARIRLMMIYSGAVGFCAWEGWCAVTGGSAIQASPSGKLPPEADLVQALVELIRIPKVDQVTFAAENPCGLELSFDPPLVGGPIDVSLGARVDILETICVPPEVPAGGRLDCAVRFFADDVLLGVQRVTVDVGCTLHVLDFETEDDGTTPLVNGQSIGTPPEFGRLVTISGAGPNLGPVAFDSTPGGPNDPSINSDMLVGHGNLLLLQDSARPRQSGGVFATPTDDPQGGEMIFDFLAPIDPRSLLLADINPPPNLGAVVSLFDEGGLTRVYAIEPGWTGTYGNAGPHRLDLTTLLPQPGNGTPRFARATEAPGFRQERVVKLVVHMTGYGALDELTFCQ